MAANTGDCQAVIITKITNSNYNKCSKCSKCSNIFDISFNALSFDTLISYSFFTQLLQDEISVEMPCNVVLFP